jgi:hypothetical protein
MAALFVSACSSDTPPAQITSDRPDQRPVIEQPDQPTQAELRKARAERNRASNAVQTSASAASQTQSDYYGSMQRRLIAQGKLRRDRVPQDAPITAESLTRDFLAIALRDEYSRSGDGLVSDSHAAPLRRWEQPVRIQLEFGPSTEIAERSAWRSEVASFANRLSDATKHPVTLTADRGNFPVLVLSEDERRNIGPRLAALVPGIPPQDIAVLANLPPAISCTVFAYSKGNASEYAHAVAIIRGELPALLRTSCIHEEIAQGMGLANDSPAARPSIFNDDEEFALLTRHDELLLQILYDRRLRPGMPEGQAAPIVRQIASELLGEAA